MSIKLPEFTLVLGGAASGKSEAAERLVAGSGRAMTYIATATAGDDEMRAKIDAHRARRGARWSTVEAPFDLTEALAGVPAAGAVLVDCASLWLSNHLLSGHDLAREQARLLDAIAACPAPVVMVSNEVGSGGVSDNALARQFQTAQGRLNQTLAARAGLVVLVVAGLVQVLKGRMPEGTL
ncbi:bifunctional adenosylcobinamide kinase/adenosylcobinamide-phosphate guanylyltransferase [Maritimibacter fusiformis]|uniref:Bifunctional adenosylcobalamin biosynthesis protein n=1 Tax=Maritimibacter fusiformis TaxID=2603819 RepID=A0A5D0RLF1_9RHOB|nr:bifunctional adenosylcobinamide kinase/adenosylcobinamide-phosphate guanylyltransferase [Maritimibacter fusiformis]TYB82283.1 bifunctional adenosylcobinamide kinase/adenosylcobinamide-phosphate guanylyltransferase [Maritimibacter fusiformis]